MSDPVPHTLCDAVDGSVLMGHMGEFARWMKLSGTPDELTSLRYVQRRLDAFGYRTTLLHHDAYISLPGRARVDVDNQALTSITHSFSRSSPAEGVTGRLVYVGDGNAADFARHDVRGAIVLTEGIASPAQAANASGAGAVGQVQISPHEHLHEMCVSPVWGSPSAETLAQLPSTVVCTVSNADGSALRERLARGEHPRVTLHAEVDSGWRQTPILNWPGTRWAGCRMDPSCFTLRPSRHLVLRRDGQRRGQRDNAGGGAADGAGTKAMAARAAVVLLVRSLARTGIPAPPGMPISTGTSWSDAVRCTSTSIPPAGLARWCWSMRRRRRNCWRWQARRSAHKPEQSMSASACPGRPTNRSGASAFRRCSVR